MATAKRTELPTLIAIDELAGHLGVSVRHVRRLVDERRIPFLKWGHLLRFDTEEVSKWLQEAHVDLELRSPSAPLQSTRRRVHR